MAQIQEEQIDLMIAEFTLDRAFLRSAVELLEDGATVPFVARYRKERTGGMDEVVIRQVRDRYAFLCEMRSRKKTIIKTIKKQGHLTPELEAKIMACEQRVALEDLYLPFKPRKMTRGQAAREKGLEPFANELLQVDVEQDPQEVAARAAAALGDGMVVEDALQGISDIIAEKVAENAEIRGALRTLAHNEGILVSKVKKDKEKEASRFQNYYDFSEKASEIPAHRILALRRGEKESFIQVDLEFDREKMLMEIRKHFALGEGEARKVFMETVFADAGDRILKPSLANEVRAEIKRRADNESIEVFSDNLQEILLGAPVGERVVIGVDPGVRTGCKLAVVDSTGKFLESALVFVVGDNAKLEEAAATVKALVDKFKPAFVAVGNGTASRETEQALRKVMEGMEDGPSMVVVNESGASVYSASELGREEFPNLDITVRGAISIARRLQDPLAELIKVDPRSIGVGQYQYDVNQTLLRLKLDEVVESCVNRVGVEVNTASASLLTYVSGIGPAVARALVEYRNERGRFGSRARLMDVKGLGPKSFEQSAGFLRIRDSEIPLDNSAIHPESYYVVEKIAQHLQQDVEAVMGNDELVDSLDKASFVDEQTGLPTIEDIFEELKKPGRDPRESFQQVNFRADVTEVGHLVEGMILEGKISNVTRFGVFVDIGVHQDGLVHISEISQKFIKDPTEVVRVGQIVKVKVLGLEKDRNRISLSIKALQEKPKARRRPAKGDKKGKKPAAGRKPSGPDGKGRKRPPAQKRPAPKPEKLKTLDDLLNRFGDPHKKN